MNKLNNVDLNNKVKNKFIYYKEYFLNINDNNYKFILEGKENKIIMKIKTYENELNFNEVKKLMNIHFKSINELFKYIDDLFEKNKVYIKENPDDNIINIIFKSKTDNLEKNIELILTDKNANKDYIINNLNQQYLKVQHELELLKSNKDIIKDKDNPLYMKLYKKISINSYAHFALDNSFILVKSLSNINYIIYSTKDISIISQNIMNFQILTEVKKAHEKYITNFRHFLDEENKRDIIMSISSLENNIKLWDLKNWICLSNIKDINNQICLHAASFFRDKKENKNYIITSNDNHLAPEPIKFFDFDGNKIKEMNNSNKRTYFLDIFYDNNLDKNYIITGNNGMVCSYDIENNDIYHEYLEKYEYYYIDDHSSIIMIKDNEAVKMIESCYDGYIRIWNFHTGLLLNKIKIGKERLYGICLWNDDYLFVGCKDNSLKLVDLRKNFVINNLKSDSLIANIKKFNHKYGDCLITHDWRNQIKMWMIEK